MCARKFKKRQTRPKPRWQLAIAKDRIRILFDEAEKRFRDRPELSDRYVELARKIGMKYNVPIPAKYKRKFCKKCHKYLCAGINARVRLNPKEKCVNITCLECGEIMRVGYSKKRAKKPQANK